MNPIDQPERPASRAWLYDLLLIIVLIAGALFRTIGLNWDANQHLHPDERFLTMVETAMMPTSTSQDQLGPPPTAATQAWRAAYPSSLPDCTKWGGYFDTSCSPLNPNNRGYSFYVYGDLPIVAVRYTAEAMNQLQQWAAETLAQHPNIGLGGKLLAMTAAGPSWTGYDGITLLGRQASALADLLTIFLMYLSASRLYGRKTALLTAAFSAFAVLQIQLSHFFTVETTTNLFMYVAIYFAVRISTGEWRPAAYEWSPWTGKNRFTFYLKAILNDPLMWASLGFGVAEAAAMASKVNAFPLALLLPAAFGVLYARMRSKGIWAGYQTPAQDDETAWALPSRMRFDPAWYILALLVLGGAACVIAFRIFQPYAFIGLRPNPAWIDVLQAQRAQASGDVDFPPALQWADRPVYFAGMNMVLWGLGIPLGLLAVMGYIWMGWRILRGEWKEHILLWGWTGFYFAWQSIQWNPTMRYLMPIYPLAAMMAAWFLVQLAHTRVALRRSNGSGRTLSLKPVAILLGVVALGLTITWAYAFTRIYTQPHTRVAASEWIFQNVPGPFSLQIQTADGTSVAQQISFPYGGQVRPGLPYQSGFIANASGLVDSVYVKKAVSPAIPPAPITLNVSLTDQPGTPAGSGLASGTLTSTFGAKEDPLGESYTVKFDRPVELKEGALYYLQLDSPDGLLMFSGSAPINESSWDDGLPLRMDNYDAYGGLYQGDMSLELYWDDNPEKLARLETMLNQGDYIFISSDRQWATTTRVPERYPLTTAYYRALIGCPADQDIIWCYNVAQPGQFKGQLGYDLVKVFESFPTLGKWQVNDQFAEEAFTVYDHPKVLIFKKAANYDPAKVHSILGSVDLNNVIHVLPRQAKSHPGDLMLPAAMLVLQRAGGTWSQLFNLNNIQNSQAYVGLLLWYLTIFALGLFAYPILRLLLPGLADRGYPLARLSGLLIWSYLAWLAGSIGIAYSRINIGLFLLGLALIGGVLAIVQRRELAQELRGRWRYFLMAEVLFLGFFVLDLLIRLGNPDLWHPSKGGERPMDFSYLNAVIKSTVFPPYDPWFAGGYINYYYYGFVLVATPIKFLGIVPSVAYNMALPTLYAMLAMGGFSLVWNLVSGPPKESGEARERRNPLFTYRFWAAMAASAALVLVGNLGVPRMIYLGFINLASPNSAVVENSNIFQRLGWAAEGLVRASTGEPLPYGPGDWYWNPSRVIPAENEIEPITEFPLFTFLYSDLHAHMIALPITLLALAWSLSLILARARWRNKWVLLASFAFGGLVIGALRPTNTWDLPTYLALGCITVIYAVWRYADVNHRPFGLPAWSLRLIYALGGAALLAGLSLLLYQPFANWYGQAYGAVDPWVGSDTPISSYLTQWGLFLFVIVSWMAWETHEWLATTPISAVRKLRPYQALIEIALLGLLGMIVLLVFRGASVALLALPLAGWAAALLLRPGIGDAKRAILFLVGTGLFLTVVVEVVVLRNDIGRMNTVFKFYLQVWVLLGMSAAAALGWLLPETPRWNLGWRTAWETTGLVLLMGAALFLFMGGLDKIRDRWAPAAPHSLDSMAYMPYAVYADQGMDMQLQSDYQGIRWMQQNVQGSPTIVEANCVEYHWCTRFTIYTGLPGVLGWNWHQRQQRAVVPSNWVTDRVEQIDQFYLGTNSQDALAFLKRYAVEYIIVGQLERAYYPGPGLDKFPALDGTLWDKVYDNAGLQIYKVR